METTGLFYDWPGARAGLWKRMRVVLSSAPAQIPPCHLALGLGLRVRQGLGWRLGFEGGGGWGSSPSSSGSYMLQGMTGRVARVPVAARAG